MTIYATYVKVEGDTWRLMAVSALSADRARSLAEREQRRPGSLIKEASLTVREYESIRAVPRSLSLSV
jgi:hypothetical protein